MQKGSVVYATEIVELSTEGSFVKALDQALLELCHRLDSALPLWLQKNTREFARFHQTIFFPEQFPEAVHFDQFQIILLEDADS